MRAGAECAGDWCAEGGAARPPLVSGVRKGSRVFAGAGMQLSTVVRAPRMVFFVSTSRGFKVELGRELEENHCEFVTTKPRLMSSTLSTVHVLELAYRTVHFVSPVDRRSDAIRRDPSPVAVRVAAPRVVAGRACNSNRTCGLFARKRRQTELS